MEPCGGEAVPGGRLAKREGTWAAAPERPRRGEACCLSPQGELHASSAGADKPRSSAQLAAARRRPAAAHTGILGLDFIPMGIRDLLY